MKVWFELVSSLQMKIYCQAVERLHAASYGTKVAVRTVVAPGDCLSSRVETCSRLRFSTSMIVQILVRKTWF